MFLGALGGTGLLDQLQSYVEPDEDECWTDREAREAAELLCTQQDADPDDDEEGVEGDISRRKVREDAEALRGLIFAHWRGAGRSLHRAQTVVAHFPWPEEWAQPSLTVKTRYPETLRAQAARFVDLEELVVAAAATALSAPELPLGDPAFAVLGGNSRVSRAPADLWRRWRSAAGRPWEGPGTRAFLSCEIVRGMRSNRKGDDEARAAAAPLIASWEEEAQAAAVLADRAPRCRPAAQIPEATEAAPRHRERDFLDGLDTWTLGVLRTWTVDADWGRGVLTYTTSNGDSTVGAESPTQRPPW
ncbi:hypothetical protein ABZ439_25885 [Streptomyces sp. NPDC005840]|uniref:hypothetical protein n=1 Tax=Streptomyces sp. NPDC005840 TaxID=3157072 RepID=UPI0033DDCBAB